MDYQSTPQASLVSTKHTSLSTGVNPEVGHTTKHIRYALLDNQSKYIVSTFVFVSLLCDKQNAQHEYKDKEIKTLYMSGEYYSYSSYNI